MDALEFFFILIVHTVYIHALINNDVFFCKGYSRDMMAQRSISMNNGGGYNGGGGMDNGYNRSMSFNGKCKCLDLTGLGSPTYFLGGSAAHCFYITCGYGQREKGGDRLVSTQSFIMTFSYSLAQQHWGLLQNYDRLICLVECLNVSTTYFNLEKG